MQTWIISSDKMMKLPIHKIIQWDEKSLFSFHKINLLLEREMYSERVNHPGFSSPHKRSKIHKQGILGVSYLLIEVLNTNDQQRDKDSMHLEMLFAILWTHTYSSCYLKPKPRTLIFFFINDYKVKMLSSQFWKARSGICRDMIH